MPRGVDAGRQTRCARGDRRGGRAVLAREPRQRAGLRIRDIGTVAAIANRLGDDVGAECAGCEEHHLPIGEIRRDAPRIVELGEGRVGHEDELGAAQRRGDVRRDAGDIDPTLAVGVLERQRLRRGERLRVAAPEPHLVAALGEIGGGGIGAVAAADDGDPHLMPTQPLCEMSKTTPFGSRNLRSKSTPPPPLSSR